MEQRVKKNNVQMKIKLAGADICKTVNGSDYNRDSLTAILSENLFTKISIPLYSYRDLIVEEGKPGNVIVGFVSGYDKEKEEFTVTVYESSAAKVTDFKDAVIYPRVTINYETLDVKMIIGLDICPAAYRK
jgi:hypothetical protein